MAYLSAQVSAMSIASVCTFKDQSYAVRIMVRDFLKRYATLSMRHKAHWRRTVALDTKARIEAAYECYVFLYVLYARCCFAKLRSFRSRDNPADRIITKNYVFLKTRAYLSLESRRSIEMERNAEKIQAWWRMLVKRFAFRAYRHSVILVQVSKSRH